MALWKFWRSFCKRASRRCTLTVHNCTWGLAVSWCWKFPIHCLSFGITESERVCLRLVEVLFAIFCQTGSFYFQHKHSRQPAKNLIPTFLAYRTKQLIDIWRKTGNHRQMEDTTQKVFDCLAGKHVDAIWRDSIPSSIFFPDTFLFRSCWKRRAVATVVPHLSQAATWGAFFPKAIWQHDGAQQGEQSQTWWQTWNKLLAPCWYLYWELVLNCQESSAHAGSALLL